MQHYNIIYKDSGPLFRIILNLADVCASIYHTIHTLILTITLFLGIVDLRNSGPVPSTSVLCYYSNARASSWGPPNVYLVNS